MEEPPGWHAWCRVQSAGCVRGWVDVKGQVWCVGVWVCGCVGVWVCGCVGVWLCVCALWGMIVMATHVEKSGDTCNKDAATHTRFRV
jgi:hypothetical protein